MPSQIGARRPRAWPFAVFLILIGLAAVSACQGDATPAARPFPFRAQPLMTVSPDGDKVDAMSTTRAVVVAAPATKIAQLVGDFDAERQTLTANRTASRYGLTGTDLGVPFRHKDRLYLLFGDSHGRREGDAIAFTRSTDPEAGLDLEFLYDAPGTSGTAGIPIAAGPKDTAAVYRPIVIPGISQDFFEVPVAGISVNNRMYVYHTTDATRANGVERMGRSVLAASDDDGHTFSLLHSLSTQFFINVSLVEVNPLAWREVPPVPAGAPGTGLLIFGSGEYRRSNVYLAFQPAAQIADRASIRYWAGVDRAGSPVWSTQEQAAQPLFDQPCVGELSVTYNPFLKKWIMLYNCDLPGLRGINVRTADRPWGPWSVPQVVFDPWRDRGYCRFIHVSWLVDRCDSVHDPDRQNEWGGEYGPYQFAEFARGNSTTTTIYFTLSTWNPYTVVLMRASLRLAP